MASCMILKCPRRSPYLNSQTGACSLKTSMTSLSFITGMGEPVGQKVYLA
ncbi:rCG64148 [Rattus norvegicus]|uniref:RCG64148 n=1 Tax=Rattus norvegicus TaxID=10116 RepID=A6JMU4_RAT|nr:rCG64148 [Rattus norvegicus]